MAKVIFAGVAALLVPVAFAQKTEGGTPNGNAHFVGLPTFVDNGFSLTVGHKIAGFSANLDANYGVLVNLEGNGFIESICRNKGKTAPPGQNPATSTTGSLYSNFTTDDNGGSFSFSVTTQYANDLKCCGANDCLVDQSLCPDGCDACQWGEGLEKCPNTRNWNQYSSGVAYNNFDVTIVLSDQNNIEVWRLYQKCTFAVPTKDYTKNTITCDPGICLVGLNDGCGNQNINNFSLFVAAGAIALAGMAGVLVYARRRSSKVSISPSDEQEEEMDAVIFHTSVPHLEEQKA